MGDSYAHPSIHQSNHPSIDPIIQYRLPNIIFSRTVPFAVLYCTELLTVLYRTATTLPGFNVPDSTACRTEHTPRCTCTIFRIATAYNTTPHRTVPLPYIAGLYRLRFRILHRITVPYRTVPLTVLHYVPLPILHHVPLTILCHVPFTMKYHVTCTTTRLPYCTA